MWDQSSSSQFGQIIQSLMQQNPQVGCLFIDFSDGARLRINGRAEIHEHGPLMTHFPGSRRVVLVNIDEVVPNCAQHIPRLVAANPLKDQQA